MTNRNTNIPVKFTQPTFWEKDIKIQEQIIQSLQLANYIIKLEKVIANYEKDIQDRVDRICACKNEAFQCEKQTIRIENLMQTKNLSEENIAECKEIIAINNEALDKFNKAIENDSKFKKIHYEKMSKLQETLFQLKQQLDTLRTQNQQPSLPLTKFTPNLN